MQEVKNNFCGICNDRSIRNSLLVVLAILAVFIFAKTLGEFKRVPSAGSENPVYNTIMVSGLGEVVGAPDIASVSFSVKTESLSIAEAQKDVTDKVARIVEYLKENGVKEKDIKTSGYNIYPRYEYLRSYVYPYDSTGRQNLAAYVVNESVSIKIRDLASAGKIIGGLGELGANEVSGLSFGFEDDEGMMAEARALAIKDARAKAKKLSLDLGVSLGRIVNFSEGGFYPYAKMEAFGRGGDMAMADSSIVPINPGENKIISNVTITYEIR